MNSRIKKKIHTQINKGDFHSLDELIDDNETLAKEAFEHLRFRHKVNELYELTEVLNKSPQKSIVLKIIENGIKIIKNTFEVDFEDAVFVRGENELEKKDLSNINAPFGKLIKLNQEQLLAIISVKYKKLSLSAGGNVLIKASNNQIKEIKLGIGKNILTIDDEPYEIESL